MIKNKKILIIGGIGIFVIILLTIIFINWDNLFVNKNPDGKLIAHEYKELNGKKYVDDNRYPAVLLPSKNNIKYISSDEVVDIFNKKKDAVIYMGYAECLSCRHVIEVLYNTSKNTILDTIYYLDTTQVTGYNNEELFKLLGEDFIYEFEGEKSLDVPFVLFIVNGSIVSYHKGTVPYHNVYEDLTQEQEKSLMDIYEYGIIDVLNSINEKKYRQ